MVPAQAQITPIERYPVEMGLDPMSLTVGPDGQMWFSGRLLGASLSGTMLVRMGIDGSTLSTLSLSTWSLPSFVTAGPDGNVWANTWDNTVLRVSPEGAIDRFNMPSSLGGYASGIAAGSDGSVWMAMQFGLAQIHPDGTSVAHPIQTNYYLNGTIINGPDGQLWLYDDFSGRLIRVDPITGSMQSRDLWSLGLWINNLAVGVDQQVWFVTSSDVGKIDPLSGQITLFPTPTSPLSSIAAGPDGNMWYVGNDNNVIGRITPQGKITEYRLPFFTTGRSITLGADGKLWYVETTKDPSGQQPDKSSIATFGIPAAVTASVNGGGGSITPASQDLRLGLAATLSVQPAPEHLIESVSADRCGPLSFSQDGSSTLVTARLSSDCAVTARFTQPSCVASPSLGLSGAPVQFDCAGLPQDGALALEGAVCSAASAGRAVCTGTIGNADGRGVVSDAAGHRLALPATVTVIPPARCSASPAAAFASTLIHLQCSPLAEPATLTIAGAVCGPPAQGSAQCSGVLGAGPGQLHEDALAITTLADGSSASSTLALRILPPPVCTASPNPVRGNDPVDIRCPEAPEGATLQMPDAQCLASPTGVGCQGIAGKGPGQIGPDPVVNVLYAGGQASVKVPLTLESGLGPETPPDPGLPADGVQTVPVLRPLGLALLALTLAVLGFSSRRGRR